MLRVLAFAGMQCSGVGDRGTTTLIKNNDETDKHTLVNGSLKALPSRNDRPRPLTRSKWIFSVSSSKLSDKTNGEAKRKKTRLSASWLNQL